MESILRSVDREPNAQNYDPLSKTGWLDCAVCTAGCQRKKLQLTKRWAETSKEGRYYYLKLYASPPRQSKSPQLVVKILLDNSAIIIDPHCVDLGCFIVKSQDEEYLFDAGNELERQNWLTLFKKIRKTVSDYKSLVLKDPLLRNSLILEEDYECLSPEAIARLGRRLPRPKILTLTNQTTPSDQKPCDRRSANRFSFTSISSKGSSGTPELNPASPQSSVSKFGQKMRSSFKKGKSLSHKRSSSNGAEEVLSLEQATKKIQFLEHQLELERDTLRNLLHHTPLTEGSILEILRAKDSTIVEMQQQLRSQEDVINSFTQGKMFTNDQSIQTNHDVDMESLSDIVNALRSQNALLNSEILDLHDLLNEADKRKSKLFFEASDWEARFYQLQSKHVLLLNELHSPGSPEEDHANVLARLLKDALDTNHTPNLMCTGPYDELGFRCSDTGLYTSKDLFNDVGMEEEAKWDVLLVDLEARDAKRKLRDLKQAVRKGTPLKVRSRLWRALLQWRLRNCADYQQVQNGTGCYQKLLSFCRPGATQSAAAKQIELDLLRTLPHNRHFQSIHADRIPPLRRVLLAYSLRNSDVTYCQGFNRLAAVALLFLSEEEAFWCLMCITELLQPPNYYDNMLLGAQADQRVLNDLLADKVPRLAAHLNEYGVDVGLVSLNWFLCIFVDNLLPTTYLYIWDCFLLEGNKVLFRFALAVCKLAEEEALKQCEPVAILLAIRQCAERILPTPEFIQAAFQGLNTFSHRTIISRREYHLRALKVEQEEVEAVRRQFRSSSLVDSKRLVGSDSDD